MKRIHTKDQKIKKIKVKYLRFVAFYLSISFVFQWKKNYSKCKNEEKEFNHSCELWKILHVLCINAKCSIQFVFYRSIGAPTSRWTRRSTERHILLVTSFSWKQSASTYRWIAARSSQWTIIRFGLYVGTAIASPSTKFAIHQIFIVSFVTTTRRWQPTKQCKFIELLSRIVVFIIQMS